MYFLFLVISTIITQVPNTCNVLKLETGTDPSFTQLVKHQAQAINSIKFTSWIISCRRRFNDHCGCFRKFWAIFTSLLEKLYISTSSVTTSSIEQNTEWLIDEFTRVIQPISLLPAPFCTVARSNTD